MGATTNIAIQDTYKKYQNHRASCKPTHKNRQASHGVIHERHEKH